MMFIPLLELVFWVDYPLYLWLLLGVLYTLVFAVASLSKVFQQYPPAKKNHRYCILLPTIKGLDQNVLDAATSFNQLNYPRDRFDCVVSTSSLKSATRTELEAMGVIVLEFPHAAESQNGFINLAIKQLNPENYDALILMNANNLVDADFLTHVNNAFHSGGMVVQTHRISKIYPTNMSWLGALMDEINHSIFRRGHVKLGLSSSLVGSGMVFNYRWFYDNADFSENYDLTKQLEAKLLLQGIYVEYLESVYTYEDTIKNVSAYTRQRNEWSSYKKPPKRHLFRDFRHALIAGNMDYCDKIFQWVMPSKILMLGFLIIITAITTYFNPMLSVKWWILLGIQLFAFVMAIPDKLLTFRTFWALVLLPIMFLSVLLNKLFARSGR